VGMTAFDEATAIIPVGGGCYHVRPDERFAMAAPDGGAGPVNGGVLLASVLRAVLDSSPHPYPVATSAHFLRVPQPRPAHVRVAWLKEGKTASAARATVVQDGACMLEVTVTTGDLDDSGDGAIAWAGEPPVLPPPEDCLGLSGPPGVAGPAGVAGPPGMAGRHGLAGGYIAQVDLRLDPATVGWMHGDPAGVPEMRGYFRLREDREPDALLLALAVDSMPPVVFGLGPVGWSPTAELTWHMRAVPAPGLLLVASRCRQVSAGWFDEEVEVWDSAGRLVAQSRQLARVGRRRKPDGGTP
jgi:Acyl-CoA thioesterase C-terminal domain/Acyl-CoA thioesterase N-terminal domain